MLAKIDALNKKIDTLMRERDRIEAQKDVYGEKLNSSLAKYKEDYGIDLVGIDFESTKENIKNEFSIVNDKVTKEYELAQRVVSAIDSGDIDLANTLVGVNTKKDTPSQQIKVASTPDEESSGVGVGDVLTSGDGDVPDTADGTGTGANTIGSDFGDDILGAVEDEFYDDDFSSYKDSIDDGFSSDDSASMKGDSPTDYGSSDDDTPKTSTGVFLDDVVGIPNGIKYATKPVGKPKLQGIKMGSFSLDSDDDEDDDFDEDEDIVADSSFGFGDMLKGSKFSL